MSVDHDDGGTSGQRMSRWQTVSCRGVLGYTRWVGRSQTQTLSRTRPCARASLVLAVLSAVTVATVKMETAEAGDPVAKVKTSTETGASAKRIVVLPLETPNKEVGIYSRSLASAIAQRLAKKLSIDVRVGSAEGGAASGVDLVVAGSIQPTRNGFILEARVRDPDRSSQSVGAVSAKARPLGKIKQSATELARRLAPVISQWRRKKRARAPIRLPGSEHVFARNRASASVGTSVARAPTGEAQPAVRQPDFIVATASGFAAEGSVRVEEAATDAAYAFADRIGINYVGSVADGRDSAVALANAARDASARYALALFITDVDFSYQGVLAARGQAIVRVVDRTGVVILEKRIRTATIVGNRGDRHTALVYGVAEQALDIALPGLVEAISR